MDADHHIRNDMHSVTFLWHGVTFFWKRVDLNVRSDFNGLSFGLGQLLQVEDAQINVKKE